MSTLLPRSRRWHLQGAAIALALVAGLVIHGVASAASLRISPVRIFLTPADSVASMVVANPGDTPVFVQTQAVSWRQVDGESQYVDTDRVTVSPPIFEIPPRREQVVRLAVRGGPAPTQEETYRVYLSEVFLDGGRTSTGVRVGLRLGVPVFVAPDGAAARVEYEYRAGCGGARIVASNAGQAHTRLRRIEVIGHPNGAPVGEVSRPTYLLAGSSISWPLASSGESPPRSVALTAVDDVGTHNHVLEARSMPGGCG